MLRDFSPCAQSELEFLWELSSLLRKFYTCYIYSFKTYFSYCASSIELYLITEHHQNYYWTLWSIINIGWINECWWYTIWTDWHSLFQSCWTCFLETWVGFLGSRTTLWPILNCFPLYRKFIAWPTYWGYIHILQRAGCCLYSWLSRIEMLGPNSWGDTHPLFPCAQGL